MHFSGMATTSKYFQKDQLKDLLQYEVEIAALVRTGMLKHLRNWVKSAEHSIEDKDDEGEDSADEEFVYISEIDVDLSE